MRYLFVHQNFPGQFLHLVSHLASQRRHEIVFITEPNANRIAGVRKVTYELPRDPIRLAHIHPDAQEFETAMRRAAAVAGMARSLRALGFTPDLVIGHEGWGEMLHLDDVWPGVPRIGYQEFYYRIEGGDVNFDPEFPVDPIEYARIRAKNAVNLLSLQSGGQGLTPTRFQHDTYPDWARPRIAILHEGVDLALCRPDPSAKMRPFRLGGFAVAPGAPLLTYVARDLEPYRGFHVMMRALPALLAARPDLSVLLVGGDGVSYGMHLEHGTWREHMLRELHGQLDPARIHFAGKIEYADYLRVLQRSDAHVYLTYPFVASWSLREAMACGCALVASDTGPVLEFVQDNETGLLTPCLDPAGLAERVLAVLEDRALAARLGAGARRFAEAELALPAYLERFEELIARCLDRKAG